MSLFTQAFFGAMPAGKVLATGVDLDISPYRAFAIECELAVRIAVDADGRFRPASVMPSLELVEPRTE